MTQRGEGEKNSKGKMVTCEDEGEGQGIYFFKFKNGSVRFSSIQKLSEHSRPQSVWVGAVSLSLNLNSPKECDRPVYQQFTVKLLKGKSLDYTIPHIAKRSGGSSIKESGTIYLLPLSWNVRQLDSSISNYLKLL